MSLSRSLIAIGSIIFGIGLFLYAYENVPFFGKLAGDLMIDQGRFKIYIPITTSIVISLILTILFNIFK